MEVREIRLYKVSFPMGRDEYIAADSISDVDRICQREFDCSPTKIEANGTAWIEDTNSY